MPESYRRSPAASAPRALLRAVSGPLVVGLAVWCAAGTLTVASAESAAVRVVAPAAWWIGALGAVVAALVPGFRQAPLSAAPALLAVVPWLPLPLPGVALLFTGPAAWLPILTALVVAEGTRWVAPVARWALTRSPGVARVIAAGVTVVACGLTLHQLDAHVPGGDEPHYLVITQSLLKDGDLRIENNHRDRDYAAYFGGELRADFINRGQDGEIYSIHAPGVSALVAPAFAAFGLRGAQWTIILVFAVTAMLVWQLAWEATLDNSAAWFTWAAVSLTATPLLLSVMVFPDSPAALGAAAGVWALVRLARGQQVMTARALVGVSIALAALPWLHTRFAVVAGGLGCCLVVALAREHGRASTERLARIATFLAVPLVSAALWFLSFYLIYGTVDPRAPYRGAESIREWIWAAVVALYTDGQFGLFTLAPVLATAVAGLFRTMERGLRWAAIGSLLVLLAYTAAAASYHMWWAGLPGLPARFLTAVVPLLAIWLAVAWHRATLGGRAMLLAALGLSLLLTLIVVTVDGGAFAWNFRDGHARLLEWAGPVVNLPRAWPSFFWGSESEFLLHAAAVSAVWIGGWLIVVTYVRRHVDSARLTRGAVAVWLLGGLMAHAAVGWQVVGATPMDPSVSQLVIHGAASRWVIGPGQVSRERGGTGLAIRQAQPPLVDHPTATVFAAGPVPAGRYRIDLEAQRPPTGGSLRVIIGRSDVPVLEWPLAPLRTQSIPLVLPAGAAAIDVRADSPEAAAGLSAVLVPESSAIEATPARHMMVGPDAQVFFADDNAYREGDGFWLRGGATTEVVWSGGIGKAGRTRVLRLHNGGSPNTITVRSGAWQEVLTLDPWQERTVSLPAADALGAWRLSLTAAAGFRPSDDGTNQDRRYLGAWFVY